MNLFCVVLGLMCEPLLEYCTKASIFLKESQDPSGTQCTVSFIAGKSALSLYDMESIRPPIGAALRRSVIKEMPRTP